MAENRKKMLKELIRQLHSGVSSQEAKERFKRVLDGVSPLEISKIEQELVKEGMPREEIQKLCDVHLAVFREQLKKQKMEIPTGHPITILMEEHKIMLQLAQKLETIANRLQPSDTANVDDEMHNLKQIAHDFQDSEKHYLREENVIFPTLEKHGITEPPSVMWTEHNQIRDKKKQLRNLIEDPNTPSFEGFKDRLSEIAQSLSSTLSSHFYKENNILFPTALQVITDNEWKKIREEFDEIGYCCFTPSDAIIPLKTEDIEGQEAEEPVASEGMLQFETGSLSEEEVEAILDSLPVDLSFVDKEDRVKYFNKAEKRIFVRTKAVIGRKVQFCHPQKSVHVVSSILDAFKEGKKDVAEFWINMKNRLIYIRYFAVKDRNGEYLGTVEVTQDLTDIKKIEGEKRLLE